METHIEAAEAFEAAAVQQVVNQAGCGYSVDSMTMVQKRQSGPPQVIMAMGPPAGVCEHLTTCSGGLLVFLQLGADERQQRVCCALSYHGAAVQDLRAYVSSQSDSVILTALSKQGTVTFLKLPAFVLQPSSTPPKGRHTRSKELTGGWSTFPVYTLCGNISSLCPKKRVPTANAVHAMTLSPNLQYNPTPNITCLVHDKDGAFLGRSTILLGLASGDVARLNPWQKHVGNKTPSVHSSSSESVDTLSSRDFDHSFIPAAYSSLFSPLPAIMRSPFMHPYPQFPPIAFITRIHSSLPCTPKANCLVVDNSLAGWLCYFGEGKESPMLPRTAAGDYIDVGVDAGGGAVVLRPAWNGDQAFAFVKYLQSNRVSVDRDDDLEDSEEVEGTRDSLNSLTHRHYVWLPPPYSMLLVGLPQYHFLAGLSVVHTHGEDSFKALRLPTHTMLTCLAFHEDAYFLFLGFDDGYIYRVDNLYEEMELWKLEPFLQTQRHSIPRIVEMNCSECGVDNVAWNRPGVTQILCCSSQLVYGTSRGTYGVCSVTLPVKKDPVVTADSGISTVTSYTTNVTPPSFLSSPLDVGYYHQFPTSSSHLVWSPPSSPEESQAEPQDESDDELDSDDYDVIILDSTEPLEDLPLNVLGHSSPQLDVQQEETDAFLRMVPLQPPSTCGIVHDSIFAHSLFSGTSDATEPCDYDIANLDWAESLLFPLPDEGNNDSFSFLNSPDHIPSTQAKSPNSTPYPNLVDFSNLDTFSDISTVAMGMMSPPQATSSKRPPRICKQASIVNIHTNAMHERFREKTKPKKNVHHENKRRKLAR